MATSYNPYAYSSQNGSNVNTGFGASQVYSPNYMRDSQNWVQSLAIPSYTKQWQANQREGVGAYSPTVQYGTGLDLASQLAAAMKAPDQLYQQQQWANANQLLQSQTLNDQAARAWNQLGLTGLQQQISLDNLQRNGLMSFLQSAYGSFV